MAKQKSYWIRSGKFTLLQRVSMLIFGFGTFYLLVRTLDKEGYGTWMLFMTVTALLDTARNGFLRNPLIRFFNKVEKDEKRTLQASSFALNVLFSLVTGGILLASAHWLADSWGSKDIQMVFYIYFITNIAYGIAFHCEYVQIANFRFSAQFVGSLLKSGIFFICVAFFYFTSYPTDVLILAVCHLGAAVISCLFMLIATRGLMHFRAAARLSWARQLFSYGKYTLGTNISAVFLRNIDIWMLGWYINPAAVAIYNVAIRVANLFEVPLMALAAIMFPQAVKKAEEEGESALKQLYEKSVSLILMMTTPLVIVVIIFSKEIIWLLAGEGYEQSAMVLNITMIYGLIIPFNKQMGILLDAIGKARLNMLIVTANAILNGIVNALLIPRFGVIGAAYATLISMLIAMLYSQIYLYKNFRVKLQNLPHYFRYFFIEIKKKVAGLL